MRDPLSVFAALVLRDGPVCYLDGQPPDDDDPLEIEHRKPRAAGGSDDLSNLALAHRSCNQAKGTRAVSS
jgi:5-methylcytosine-specific restriction endonuclease McrA